MARMPALEKLSHAELIALRDEVDALILEKKAEAKSELKQKFADLAKAQGFEIGEIVGKSGKRGTVAIKYRDPENPENTWTGRGRPPRWMAAALKKRGVKKEDFLIS